MDLRALLEALAAALIAVVMFFTGRGCGNAEYLQGVPVNNEQNQEAGEFERSDPSPDPAGIQAAPEGGTEWAQ